MLKLTLGRFLQGIVVLLVVSMLTFTLLAAAGGDALTALRTDPVVSEETIQGQARIYGLDQPLPVRYARWLVDMTRGRMGESLFFHAPVWTILRPRLLNTIGLAALALLMAWGVALALGFLAARRPGSWIDRLCGVVILLTASTPRIVLALLALAITARSSFLVIGDGAKRINAGGSLVRLLLPALVLCVPLVALFLAQARDAMRLALAEEFVQVARAKGLPERVIVWRHALRAALNPLITIFGSSLGGVLSGSVIVETVFGWPGLGQLSVVAVRSRDVPLLMGVVMLTAIAVLVGNMIADLLLRFNDPRLRRDEAKLMSVSST
jgi:peptide/nickel transport system permease protein